MIAPYAVAAQTKTTIAGKPADLSRVVRILNAVNYRGWLGLLVRPKSLEILRIRRLPYTGPPIF